MRKKGKHKKKVTIPGQGTFLNLNVSTDRLLTFTFSKNSTVRGANISPRALGVTFARYIFVYIVVYRFAMHICKDKYISLLSDYFVTRKRRGKCAFYLYRVRFS